MRFYRDTVQIHMKRALKDVKKERKSNCEVSSFVTGVHFLFKETVLCSERQCSLARLSLSVLRQICVNIWVQIVRLSVSDVHLSLRLLAFAFFLSLLELAQSPRPRVPPLDDQTAFIGHHAALPRRILVVPQQQVFLPCFHFGTLTGHVLGSDPQQLVPSADAALALLVHGHDVHSEFPPLARLVRFQDVHLNSCRRPDTPC